MRNAVKIPISMMNMKRRPNRSASPPSAVAPIRMPKRVAAPTTPCCTASSPNSSAISRNATPVMKTTRPSKNLPAAASHQMRHCMAVIGETATSVPSRQMGASSMYCWTVFVCN
jgi:hypothetical protein